MRAPAVSPGVVSRTRSTVPRRAAGRSARDRRHDRRDQHRELPARREHRQARRTEGHHFPCGGTQVHRQHEPQRPVPGTHGYFSNRTQPAWHDYRPSPPSRPRRCHASDQTGGRGHHAYDRELRPGGRERELGRRAAATAHVQGGVLLHLRLHAGIRLRGPEPGRAPPLLLAPVPYGRRPAEGACRPGASGVHGERRATGKRGYGRLPASCAGTGPAGTPGTRWRCLVPAKWSSTFPRSRRANTIWA